MKATNYKLKTKQPTKKEERDFVKNLSWREKQYSYKQLRYNLWEKYNWDGIVYYNVFQRIWRYLIGKDIFDK